MSKRLFYIVFFLLVVNTGIAQTAEIDSLKRKLTEVTGKDKSDVLILLGRRCFSFDEKVSNDYFEQAEAHSRSISYTGGISDVYFYRGRILVSKKEYKKATEEHAKALDVAKGANDESRIAKCYEYLAWALRYANAYYESITLMDEALAWAKSKSIEDAQVQFLGEKAHALYLTGDFTKAKSVFEEELKLAEKLGMKQKAGGVSMNLGIMIYRMGQPAESLPYFDQSYKIFASAGDTVNMGHAYINKGLSLYQMGEMKTAAEVFQKAGELYLAKKDKSSYTYVLSNLAMLYIDLGQFDKAMMAQMEALRQHEEDNNKRGIAGAYSGLAEINLHTKDTIRAIEYLDRAIAMNTESGSLNSLSYNLIAKGNVLSNQGKFDAAKRCYDQALVIRKRNGDQTGVAGSLLSIGNNFQRQQLLDSSLHYFQESLKIYEELGIKQSIAGLNNNIGVIYYDKGDYPTALKHYQKALEMRKELGNVLDLSETYLTFSNVYQKMGDHEKAYDYFKLYFQHYDSLNNASSKQIVADLQTKYETDKKEKEIALLSAEKRMQGMAMDKQQALLAFERIRSEKANQEVMLLNKDKSLKEAELLRANEESARKARELEALQKEKTLQEEINQQQRKITVFFIGGFVLMLMTSGVIFRYYRMNRKAKIIITQQKIEVEAQKAEAEMQKIIVEEKNREITDSIRYAKRLQEAILPPSAYIEQLLPESFVLYRPKDIVAGDFYWMEKVNDTLFLAVADCTGHGVPGAMVSIVGHNGLERTIREFRLNQPGLILDKLNELVEDTFSKSEGQVRDGMDIALCAVKNQQGKRILEYAGANNPLWLIRNGELMEYKADKQPIGHYDNRKPFSTQQIELQSGDLMYVFSDGFADQFGGPSGKKFKYARMKEELLSMCNESLKHQKERLFNLIEDWKGNLEQVDDICVVGFRVN